MVSLQITVPADRRMPRFFFRTAVEHELAGVVAAGDRGIVALVPSLEDEVGLSVFRINRWRRRGNDDSYWVRWPAAEWDEFLGSVARHWDTGGSVSFAQVQDQGEPPQEVVLLRFSLDFELVPADGGDWHLLRLSMSGGDVLPTDPGALEGLLARVAGKVAPTYAAVATGGDARLTTGWEALIGADYPAGGLPASRDHLRGYDWITYCPRAVLDRIGGAGAARASGAFHAVREIGDSLVALQATAMPGEYGPAEVQRVHEVLAPILLPGQPRPGKRVGLRAYNPAG